MVGTNSYVAKLKAQLDQAIIQRDHWKQLAESRNSILVTEVCLESRSVEEYIVGADNVRALWRLMREYREQITALEAERERLRAELEQMQKKLHLSTQHKRAGIRNVISYWRGRE